MEQFGTLILNVLLTLFALFAAAPIVLNAIATFGVQKRFAQTMIDEGVISPDEVQRILPKKQLAGVIISVIVVTVLVLVSWRAAPFGYICSGVGFVLGILKFMKVTQFNSLTVQQFQRTYADCYDEKKLKKYVEKIF